MKYNFDKIINRENTDCVKYDLREMLFNNSEAIPMWVADMDFETPDFIIDALKKRLEHPVLGYTFRSDAFYNSIIRWLDNRHNWNVKKEWISFSPGVVPALNMLTLAFTQPGDKILVQPPVYFPFFTAISNHDRVRVDNPLKLKNGRFFMDFEDLKSKIDSDVKMIFISNPHNPGGNCWKKEELEELAQICIERDVLIISDEIHSDLILPGYKHVPMATISEEIAKQTITLMAPSKTFNVAGLSTSFLIIPNEDHFKTYEKTLDAIHVGMGNALGGIGLSAAYDNGEEWLEELLSYLQSNLDFIVDYFEENLPKVKVIKPEATYMALLDFTAFDLSSEDLKNKLIHEAKVAFNEGEMFGEEGKGLQRINFACPRATLEKALGQIVNTFTNL